MDFLKRNNGVTLIAMITTVIFLLIISGVALSQIAGENGIFRSSLNSRREYKRNSIIEVIRTAEGKCETDLASDRVNIIDIEILIDKVLEISEIGREKEIQVDVINGIDRLTLTKNGIKEYIIDVDYLSQTAIIRDLLERLIIDVKIDITGEVIIDSVIADNNASEEELIDFDRPIITYALNPSAEINATEQVTINFSVTTRSPNKVVKTTFNGETPEIQDSNSVTISKSVTRNDVYEFVAEDSNGRKTTVYVTVDNIIY